MRMVVCRHLMRAHIVVGVHAVMPVLGNRDRAGHRCFPRAQHHRRHRTPNGKQDSEQDEDDDAEAAHGIELSSSQFQNSGFCHPLDAPNFAPVLSRLSKRRKEPPPVKKPRKHWVCGASCGSC
jgi:hypothetical protein